MSTLTLAITLPATAHRLGGSHAQRDVLHLTLQQAVGRVAGRRDACGPAGISNVISGGIGVTATQPAWPEMKPSRHDKQPHGDIAMDTTTAFELRFRSLFHEGRAFTFSCDAAGRVDLDTLSDRRA